MHFFIFIGMEYYESLDLTGVRIGEPPCGSETLGRTAPEVLLSGDPKASRSSPGKLIGREQKIGSRWPGDR